MKKITGGFTLLELLVVIGIIGIIMALASVAYSTTQQAGRNARRKQDMVAIQNALEQYYSESNYVYPTGNCETGAATFMKSNWPKDPDGGGRYDGDMACTSDSYCICANMEPKAPSGISTAGNSLGTDCSWTASSQYYCVSNLQ